MRGQIRPVRIVARDVPYYSNDSRWWSPDAYFKGGQISSSQEPAQGTDDPEFYETERWAAPLADQISFILIDNLRNALPNLSITRTSLDRSSRNSWMAQPRQVLI